MYNCLSAFFCDSWRCDWDRRLNDDLFVKLSQMGLGLMLCHLAWTAVVQLVVFFNSSSQWFRFSQEYLSLFHQCDQFDFVSSLWCRDWVREPLCEPNFLGTHFRIKKYIGTKGEVCRQLKIFLPPPQVLYTTDPSEAVGPVLFIFCVALWFILRGASCFKVFPCPLFSCFIIPLSIMITLSGEEGAGLCASHAFVCFVHVSFCHFSLPPGGWLRSVIMALPGLFYKLY